MTAKAWKRLADKLVARRVELGYANRAEWFRHLDIDDRSGPRRGIEGIEAARRTNYSPSTRAQIEHWYGWGTGSIDLVLGGGEPLVLIPVDRPSHAASITSLADVQRSVQDEVSVDAAIRSIRDLLGLAAEAVDTYDRALMLMSADHGINVLLDKIDGRRIIASGARQRADSARDRSAQAETKHPPALAQAANQPGEPALSPDEELP